MDDSEVARETPEAQAAPSSSGSDAGKPAWLTPGALLLQQLQCNYLLSTNAGERSCHQEWQNAVPLPSHLCCCAAGPAARVDESEDPVMSMPQPLLPKHTVVKVIGNARTKQSLVGLTGRVKKAVGLGGWHHGERISLHCKVFGLPAVPAAAAWALMWPMWLAFASLTARDVPGQSEGAGIAPGVGELHCLLHCMQPDHSTCSHLLTRFFDTRCCSPPGEWRGVQAATQRAGGLGTPHWQ